MWGIDQLILVVLSRSLYLLMVLHPCPQLALQMNLYLQQFQGKSLGAEEIYQSIPTILLQPLYLMVVRHCLHPCIPCVMLILHDNAACERLISRTFSPHELPPLIEAIFSSEDEDKTIRSLPVGDAQTLINTMDEARSTFHRCYKCVG